MGRAHEKRCGSTRTFFSCSRPGFACPVPRRARRYWRRDHQSSDAARENEAVVRAEPFETQQRPETKSSLGAVSNAGRSPPVVQLSLSRAPSRKSAKKESSERYALQLRRAYCFARLVVPLRLCLSFLRAPCRSSNGRESASGRLDFLATLQLSHESA